MVSFFTIATGGLDGIRNNVKTAITIIVTITKNEVVIPQIPNMIPPIAGPPTPAICQELLCQLTALGIFFLGTSMLTSAKEVGPLKALAIPVQKAIA